MEKKSPLFRQGTGLCRIDINTSIGGGIKTDIIYVYTHHSRCRIVFQELTALGFCGRAGSTPLKREGDMKTPLGCFPIHFGFYRGQRPETRLPMVKIHPLHRWVDDPASPLYNRLVFGRTGTHGERLADFPLQYALGLVIEYNRSPVIPGKGSAVFLHCGQASTAGCIAAGQDFLRALIARLDTKKHPHILIQ